MNFAAAVMFHYPRTANSGVYLMPSRARRETSQTSVPLAGWCLSEVDARPTLHLDRDIPESSFPDPSYLVIRRNDVPAK